MFHNEMDSLRRLPSNVEHGMGQSIQRMLPPQQLYHCHNEIVSGEIMENKKIIQIKY